MSGRATLTALKGRLSAIRVASYSWFTLITQSQLKLFWKINFLLYNKQREDSAESSCSPGAPAVIPLLATRQSKAKFLSSLAPLTWRNGF